MKNVKKTKKIRFFLHFFCFLYGWNKGNCITLHSNRVDYAH
jgi:hypothetical protein